MINVLSLIILLNTFLMAQNPDENMQKLLWIVDNWVSHEENKVSTEKWVKVNDNLYEGESVTKVKGNTVFHEILKLEKNDEGIFYIADVPHNPGPVKFRLTSVNDTVAVFENPAHDFPEKITYVNENGNLHAFIEGPGKDGVNKKIDFYFLKER